MKTKPLQWSVEGTKSSFFDRLFSWYSYFGKAKRIYADLLQQLDARSQEDLNQWEKYPGYIHKLSTQVSDILIENLDWPDTSIFLPDDPVEILFWPTSDGLDFVDAFMEIERLLGIEIGDEFWEEADQTYAQFLKKLDETRMQNYR